MNENLSETSDSDDRLLTEEFPRSDAKLEEYCWPDTLRSWPAEYEKKPLLRNTIKEK